VGNTNEPIYAVEQLGTWGPLIAIGGFSAGAKLTSVSCVSTGNCVALGSSYEGMIIEDEVNGVWQAPTALLEGIDPLSVSCTSMKECVAVGSATGVPMAQIEMKGKWGAPTEIPTSTNEGALDSVSCVSTGNCDAVGFEGSTNTYNATPMSVTLVNGVWGTSQEVSLPNRYGWFTGVSCPSALNCVAVGQDSPGSGGSPFYEVGSQSNWSTRRTFPGAASDAAGVDVVSGVSCPSDNNCVASGYFGGPYPDYSVDSNTHWADLAAFGSATYEVGHFYAVGCPPRGPCTLVGDDQQSSKADAVSLSAAQNPIAIHVAHLRGVAGTPVKVTVTGGSSTSVPLSVSGRGCSVSGSALRADGASSCVLRAAAPAIDFYEVSSAAPVTVHFTLARQRALLLRATATSSGFVLSASGGSGAGKVAFAATGRGCRLSGRLLTAAVGARCVVTATKAAQGIYARAAATSSLVIVGP
jgi:hypothetical protein